MIFNRTQNDIDNAISLRDTKVKNFQELTQSEIDTLERGTMTINTLNRIETKQQELKNLFNAMGYWDTPITNKSWSVYDLFSADDFQRILENVNTLRRAFFVYKDTPNTPDVSYHYEDINALEKILYDLDVMINNVKSNYRECGTFESGE